MDGKNNRLIPRGWQPGDTCRMITNKRKGVTGAYIVKGYDGRYYEVISNTGTLHRASPERLFHTHEEAIEFLVKNNQKGECR